MANHTGRGYFQKGDARRWTGGRQVDPMRRALNKLLEDDDWEAGVEVIRAQIRRGDRAAMQMAAGYLGEVIVTKGESGGPGDFEIGLDEARKVLRLGSKRRRQNAG